MSPLRLIPIHRVDAHSAPRRSSEGVLPGIVWTQADEQADGLFIDAPVEQETLLRCMNRMLCVPRERPALILLYGAKIPAGLADWLQQQIPAHHGEVVRFLLFANGEKACIGAQMNGWWTHVLRRLLAAHQVISLVCRQAEVDEIARLLPAYLEWKQQFFFRMARTCSAPKVRLEVLSQALGMDERIGQIWMNAEPTGCEPGSEPAKWLLAQCSQMIGERGITRMVMYGEEETIRSLASVLSKRRDELDIRLVSPRLDEKTNDQSRFQVICRDLHDRLEGTDLFAIASPDPAVQAIDLAQLKQKMRRPLIIDAASLFPRQEVDRYGVEYLSCGQNTNVKNENYTDGR